MARIRTIKPGFFTHAELFDAEKASGLPLRLAFAGLWCVADRDGRFKWRPREIKLVVLPYDDIDMVAVLDALVKYRFIIKYKCTGEEYGSIPSFSVHQHVNPREAPSVIPSPTEADASPTRKPRVKDANPTRLREELVVRKGREQEGKGTVKKVVPADAGDFASAILVFNLSAQNAGWPQAQRLTAKRQTALKARLNECGGISGWSDSMHRAERSDFLTGRTPRANGHEKWMPDLDFFLQQQSFTKLMEGSYDNHRTAERKSTLVEATELALAAADACDAARNHRGTEPPFSRDGPSIGHDQGGSSPEIRRLVRRPEGQDR